MRRIFTFCFITISLLVACFNSLGQCTTTSYNFSTGTTTQGFSGSQTSGSGTFSALALAGNQLRSTVTANSPNTYTIISPTFTDATGPINFTFDYSAGPQATISGVEYSMKYVSNLSNTVVSTPLQTYTNGSCTTIARPADMSGNDYQIVAVYTVTAGNGNASNSYIGFDNFGTDGTLASTVLPVKFSSLDAKTINNSVSLKWTVGSEINVTGYEIEKSTDGRNFSKIGFVTAAAQTSYSFVDPKPSSVSYYRIKSVDGDGKFAFSTVALVKAGKTMIVLKAFPSPFINTLSVQHATANGNSLISISSEDGRLIKTVVPVTGTQQTDINLSSAAPGLYLVRFTNGNKDVQTLKILKQQ